MAVVVMVMLRSWAVQSELLVGRGEKYGVLMKGTVEWNGWLDDSGYLLVWVAEMR